MAVSCFAQFFVSIVFFFASQAHASLLSSYVSDMAKKNPHCCTYPLHEAVRKHNLPEIYSLIATHSLTQRGIGGFTVLHEAVSAEYFDLTYFFLEREKSLLFTPSKVGDTPLHLAIKRRSVDIINLILRYTPNLNAQNAALKTPLHLAVQESLLDIVERLLQDGASVNVADKHGRTPLYYAVEQGSLAIVSLLMLYGADPAVVSTEGVSVYRLAIALDNKSIIEVLKQETGIYS